MLIAIYVMFGLGIFYMLAELTHIDTMMDLESGRNNSYEKDNLNPQNSIFSLIENNVIARDELKQSATTDNTADGGSFRRENKFDGVKNSIKEEIRNSIDNNKNEKVNTKDNSKDEKEKSNSIDESSINGDLIVDQKRNHKKENKHLIQNINNKNVNSSWLEKAHSEVSIYSTKDGKTQNVQKEIISNIYADKPDKKELAIINHINEKIKNGNDGKLEVSKLSNNIEAKNSEQKNNIIKEENVKEIKANINELKSDKNELHIKENQNNTNTIKQAHDETKNLTEKFTEATKVIKTNLNEIKNNNKEIISKIKNIYNESTKNEKSNINESLLNKLNIKNIKESNKKVEVINETKSNASKISQFINNNFNQKDITNKPTANDIGNENINISGKNIKSDITSDVNKQILESINSSISRQGVDKQITVQLNPPELGKVVIKFQEQNSEITGHLEISKPETRFEVEQALPQIVRNLNDNGIQIRKMEVVSTDINQSQQESQESFKEQLFSGDDTSQGHTAANDERKGGSDNTGFYDWLSNKSGRNSNGLGNNFVANKSINLLI